MTDNFDIDSRNALVVYRIERANKTLQEVDVLIENQLYSTAINRLYYAVYYAAIALLVKEGISASSHAGVRSMLGLHYIRTGRIKKEIGNNYNLLFERRHSCDYDDFIESSLEEVKELVPLAKSFIEAVTNLITP